MVFDICVVLVAQTRTQLKDASLALLGTTDISTLRAHASRVFEISPPDSAAIFRILPSAGARLVRLNVSPSDLSLVVTAQGTPPLDPSTFASLCDSAGIHRATLSYTCALFNASGAWSREVPGPFTYTTARIDASVPSTPLPAHYILS